MLSNANEIDTLRNPKEGCYDKGPAACSLHEGRWSFLNPEFPGERRASELKGRSTLMLIPQTFMHLFWRIGVTPQQEQDPRCGEPHLVCGMSQFGYLATGSRPEKIGWERDAVRMQGRRKKAPSMRCFLCEVRERDRLKETHS